jgi:hypothetical protein
MSRSSKSGWPLEIKSGSAVVKIYRTQKASGYTVFYKGHERKVGLLQDLDLAKSEAKRIADSIYGTLDDGTTVDTINPDVINASLWSQNPQR